VHAACSGKVSGSSHLPTSANSSRPNSEQKQSLAVQFDVAVVFICVQADVILIILL
jgi:hypothetical protein